MAVPTDIEFSVDALEDAHTAIRDLLDETGEQSGLGGTIRIFDASDLQLAEVTLERPCGTVDSGTGQLTLLPDGDATATNAGTAAYCEITNSAFIAKIRAPAVEGSSAVTNRIVLSTLTVDVGNTITVLSATIG